MICVVCRQAETVDGRTPVAFERGEFRLLVNRVPARFCPGCGEVYVDEVVAGQLLRLAAREAATGLLDTQIEYGTFQI